MTHEERLRAIADPGTMLRRAAALCGVDATTPTARVFVRAAGARDVAIGAILLGLLTRRSNL